MTILNQLATDGGVDVTILATVADAHLAVIVELNHTGALDLREEAIDRIVDPDKFSVLAAKCTFANLLAGRVRL